MTRNSTIGVFPQYYYSNHIREDEIITNGRPFGRSEYNWKDNITVDFTKIEYNDME
jgi:hypothetical protein